MKTGQVKTEVISPSIASDRYPRHIKALGGQWFYGVEGYTWQDGYIILDGRKVEHYNYDYAISAEGYEAFMRLVAEQKKTN